MTDIPERLFGSNIVRFCKHYTDLLNFFKKHLPFPNDASWIIFRPSSVVGTKVISMPWMKNLETGEWIKLKKAWKYVEKMVFLCQTFRGGSLATGFHVPAASSVTYRLRSLRTLSPLWSRQTSSNWHSLWSALVRWYGSRFCLWRKSHKVSRRKIFSATTGTNDGRMEEIVSSH